jgi:hypothetical protein
MSMLAAGSLGFVSGAWSEVAEAQAAKPARPTPARRLSNAAAQDLKKQKQFARQALKTIREFPLPAGSDPAFVFVALKVRRTRGGQ